MISNDIEIAKAGDSLTEGRRSLFCVCIRCNAILPIRSNSRDSHAIVFWNRFELNSSETGLVCFVDRRLVATSGRIRCRDCVYLTLIVISYSMGIFTTFSRPYETTWRCTAKEREWIWYLYVDEFDVGLSPLPQTKLSPVFFASWNRWL